MGYASFQGLFGLHEDYTENRLSLDSFHELSKPSIFLFRAESALLAPLILAGDIVIVDRSLPLESSYLGVFFWEGKRLCRRYFKKEQGHFLYSEEKNLKPLCIGDDQDLEYIGRVVGLSRHV